MPLCVGMQGWDGSGVAAVSARVLQDAVVLNVVASPVFGLLRHCQLYNIDAVSRLSLAVKYEDAGNELDWPHWAVGVKSGVFVV
jgi:hypothetical protein